MSRLRRAWTFHTGEWSDGTKIPTRSAFECTPVVLAGRSAHAVPITYRGRKTGRQFVVVAAGGGNRYGSTYADALVAFTLPE